MSHGKNFTSVQLVDQKSKYHVFVSKVVSTLKQKSKKQPPYLTIYNIVGKVEQLNIGLVLVI